MEGDRKVSASFVYTGDEEAAIGLKSYALMQLNILHEAMSFQSLQQDSRFVRLQDGSEIMLQSVFGQDFVSIYVPSVVEAVVKDEEEPQFFYLKLWRVDQDAYEIKPNGSVFIFADAKEATLVDDNLLTWLSIVDEEDNEIFSYVIGDDTDDISYESSGRWRIKWFYELYSKRVFIRYCCNYGYPTEFPNETTMGFWGTEINRSVFLPDDFIDASLDIVYEGIIDYGMFFYFEIDGNALYYGGQRLAFRYTKRDGEAILSPWFKIPTKSIRESEGYSLGYIGPINLGEMDPSKALDIWMSKDTERGVIDYSDDLSNLRYTSGGLTGGPSLGYYMGLNKQFAFFLEHPSGVLYEFSGRRRSSEPVVKLSYQKWGVGELVIVSSVYYHNGFKVVRQGLDEEGYLAGGYVGSVDIVGGPYLVCTEIILSNTKWETLSESTSTEIITTEFVADIHVRYCSMSVCPGLKVIDRQLSGDEMYETPSGNVTQSFEGRSYHMIEYVEFFGSAWEGVETSGGGMTNDGSICLVGDTYDVALNIHGGGQLIENTDWIWTWSFEEPGDYPDNPTRWAHTYTGQQLAGCISAPIYWY